MPTTTKKTAKVVKKVPRKSPEALKIHIARTDGAQSAIVSMSKPTTLDAVRAAGIRLKRVGDVREVRITIVAVVSTASDDETYVGYEVFRIGKDGTPKSMLADLEDSEDEENQLRVRELLALTREQEKEFERAVSQTIRDTRE